MMAPALRIKLISFPCTVRPLPSSTLSPFPTPLSLQSLWSSFCHYKKPSSLLFQGSLYSPLPETSFSTFLASPAPVHPASPGLKGELLDPAQVDVPWCPVCHGHCCISLHVSQHEIRAAKKKRIQRWASPVGKKTPKYISPMNLANAIMQRGGVLRSVSGRVEEGRRGMGKVLNLTLYASECE